MATQDLLLCIDIGGDSIKAAEFSFPPEGGLVLQKFSYREYGGTADDSSDDALMDNLRDVIVSNEFKAKKAYISLSGQNAFIRFVKVPAMTDDKNKIKEIIEYEARQTIPFPLDEVVWDSQLIESSDSDSGEIEAMFVIVKKEEISKVTSVTDELGIEVASIEVAPTACYNAARANLIGENQCEMILNIGGHCSTLVFVDGGKFFVRTIPTAGHAVTQQISKEFGISFADAEEMKRRHGFVALGGAYEEPESEVAATVSKIVRNVMTRLHGEINRSINVYRAQQKGHKPEKLYLAGGSSVMAFTPRFFSEKLRVPVEYFNPFQVVTLAPDIEKESLAEVAHLFSETIGMALRKIGTCPIQVSLIPDSIRKQNELRLKLPYFYASCASLLLCLGVTYWGYTTQLDATQKKLKEVKSFVDQKVALDQKVRSSKDELDTVNAEYTGIKTMLDKRLAWVKLFNTLQKVTPDNMWFTTITVQESSGAMESGAPARNESSDMGGMSSMFGDIGGSSSGPSMAPTSGDQGILQWVILEGKCVLNDAKDDTYDVLLTNLAQEPYFTKDGITTLQLTSAINSPVNVTSFKLAVKLARPINE